MTALRPMTPEVFAAYKAAEVASFAEENIACGRWLAEGALDRSLAEFDELLPEGLSTPKNHLFEILDFDQVSRVGYLWFAAEERNGQSVAFIYDIQIQSASRRQGHAKRAIAELESLVIPLGLVRISLHVSGQNPEAHSLYTKLGFAIMGISMSKKMAQ